MSTPTLAVFIAVAIALCAAFLGERARRRRMERELADLRAARARDAAEGTTRERARALAAEREHIYRDLHDDLSGKLLSLVYGASSPQQADLARSVLQDLRDVVSRSRRPPGTLLQILGEVRVELETRLQAVPATLDWHQDELPDVALDQAQTLHLMRICREAATNALRHGAAHWLRVRIARAGDDLLVDVTDDGSFPEGGLPAGRGTANMRERADALAGAIRWDSGTLGGTKVTLRMPLPSPQAGPD